MGMLATFTEKSSILLVSVPIILFEYSLDFCFPHFWTIDIVGRSCGISSITWLVTQVLNIFSEMVLTSF